MNVLKFGGTSVGSAQRIQEVAKLISDDQPNIVVLSAMSGTTKTLVDITNYLYRNDRQEALTTIQNLELDYLMTISDLYSTEEFKHRGQEFVQTIFTYLRSFINKDFYPLQEKAVVAQGEIISTTLMHYYLQEQGIPSTLLSALDFMRIDKDCEPDYFYIEQNLKRLLSNPATERIIITQGFICRNAYGEIDNLKRGGSDYSAALIGAALKVDEIQIWTDIDGVHNSDPRYVKNTKAIKVKSSNMLLAYGFVRKVFEIFESWKTPIDMIATSEVAISLTIDSTCHLEDIKKDLTKYGTIEVEESLSIICIVGDCSINNSGLAARALTALEDIPLHMISYGASEHSISLLVKQADKQKALEALSERLLNTFCNFSERLSNAILQLLQNLI